MEQSEQMPDWKREVLARCTPEQVAAIEKLECRGLRFCADFGWSNAVSILRNLGRSWNRCDA